MTNRDDDETRTIIPAQPGFMVMGSWADDVESSHLIGWRVGRGNPEPICIDNNVLAAPFRCILLPDGRCDQDGEVFESAQDWLATCEAKHRRHKAR